LDENSNIDFRDKLNDILERCVIFQFPNGNFGSYLNIFENDRPWIIYTIREKSFPEGKILTIPVEYKIKDEVYKDSIEILRRYIEKWEKGDIWNYFDVSSRTFKFVTTFREEAYHLCPPTIGMKMCFTQYLKIKTDEGVKINENFFIMLPWLNSHETYLSYEDLEILYEWFIDKQTLEEFSFLDDLFKNHLSKIGIKGLKKNVDGRNIITSQIYPNRQERRYVFLIPNAFRLFLR
jgi:hypothetical protein